MKRWQGKAPETSPRYTLTHSIHSCTIYIHFHRPLYSHTFIPIHTICSSLHSHISHSNTRTCSLNTHLYITLTQALNSLTLTYTLHSHRHLTLSHSLAILILVSDASIEKEVYAFQKETRDTYLRNTNGGLLKKKEKE